MSQDHCSYCYTRLRSDLINFTLNGWSNLSVSLLNVSRVAKCLGEMLWSQQELLSARFLPPCHGSQVMATGPHHPSTAHNEPCLVSQTSHWQLYKFWDYYWLAHCPRQYGSVSVSSNIYKYLLNEFVQDLSLTNIILGPVNIKCTQLRSVVN